MRNALLDPIREHEMPALQRYAQCVDVSSHVRPVNDSGLIRGRRLNLNKKLRLGAVWLVRRLGFLDADRRTGKAPPPAGAAQ